MGSVRPDNTSALMVLQNASEVPLENTRAGLHEWVEDIGAILLDMMGTYYEKRPIVREKTVEEPVVGKDGQQLIDPITGQPAFTKVSKRVVEEFDFSIFKHLWLNVSVDVGATTYYSEIAMVQTLDNLRRDGTLSIIEYLERMPDKLITRKQELIESLKKRMGEIPAVAGNTSSTADAVQQAGNVARQVARRDLPHEGKVEDVPMRNYYAEWQELAQAHPEVVGKELPEDIYQACMQSELPPLRVYESMMLQKQAEQIASLQQEIATLRQNAENTARAPVSAAAGGPESEPEDLFLKGFNSY